jgi:ribonuclease HI
MITIYTDGASRGNPGPSAWAYVVALGNNQVLDHASGTIGVATNNDAEYTAIIRAMEYAIAHNMESLRILSDSEIVIRQLSGIYRCKEPRLQAKKAVIEGYVRRIPTQFGNVSREHSLIRICDRYCNQALDEEARRAVTTSNDSNVNPI